MNSESRRLRHVGRLLRFACVGAVIPWWGCGGESLQSAGTDAGTFDAADVLEESGTLDADTSDSETSTDSDGAYTEDSSAVFDTDTPDRPDSADGAEPDGSLDVDDDELMLDVTVDVCDSVDPCGGCADGTYIPIGELGEPCGPCAASQLTCRDGLTVCDMSECSCSANPDCSDGEACTAGVCAPAGWAYVPPGEFAKGCTAAYDCSPVQAERRSALRVTLSRGLLVRATEETEESWQQVMGARIVHPDPASALPAVLFSNDEVLNYLNRRSEEAGLERCYELTDNEMGYLEEWPLLQACEGWRLPTEAEWEYFARAGTDTQTWAGNPAITDWFDKSRDPLLDPIAYYFGLVAPLFDTPSEAYDCGNGRGDRQDVIALLLSEYPACRPIPVGQLQANPWGLHDVLGNVLELVWDREGENSDYTSGLDPIRPANTSTQTWAASRTRFAVGGFYGDPASSVEYLNLELYHDDRPNLHVGFRAVRSLPGVRLGRTVEPR